jgi:DNA-binding transcriptional LysR family regulator
LELNHLRYFYEVAKHGSFTAAARAIRVSQPSLSKVIRQLEERENVILFERGKNGVTLTDKGKLVFATCQLVFQELDTLQTNLTEQKDVVAGDLLLGASDNLCNYVLPPLLSDFQQKFPQVTVKLFSGSAPQIQSEILDGGAELGLFYTKVKEGREFSAEPLSFVEFALVRASRGADLGPYIGSRANDYSRAYPALEMLHSIGIRPRVAFETNNQETQKKLALLGAGFTLVPVHMVEVELKTGALRRIRTEKPLGSWVSLIWRRNRPLSKVARLFSDELRSKLKEHGKKRS